MPIRFRCVYCDKLLGIATRKAGTVVNCPQCGQPLIVPTPEGEPERAAASAPAAPSAPATAPATVPARLFERDDFDVVLQSDVTLAATENAPSPPPPKRPKTTPPPIPSPLPPRPFAVEQNLPAPPRDYPAPLPLPVPKRAPGLTLSTGKLILALAVVLFLVIAAFGVGVVVGRILVPTSSN